MRCGTDTRGQAGFRLWLVVLLLWCAVGGAVEAGGIHCAKARTRVEKTLCRDPQLLTADRDLGTFYDQVRDEVEDRAELGREQRRWLREVRDRCSDADCLRAAYQARTQALTDYAKAHPRDPSCGVTTPPSPGKDCPPRASCGVNRDGSILQAVVEDCPATSAETPPRDIAVYLYRNRQSPPEHLTTLRGREFRDLDMNERDGQGYVQLDILEFCGAGPNCVHDLYRFDPHDRELYHYFSGGYSELFYFDGYLIESGRASCCSWEWHAYKVRRVGRRELVSDRFFVITTSTLEDEGGKENEDHCQFYEYVGKDGAGIRPVEPPSRKWLDFCN